MNVTLGGAATSSTSPLPVASTIDGSADLLAIYTANVNAMQVISRNTLLGVTGQPADVSSTQSFTNKTLTAPNVSNAVLSGTLTGTYILGGTPTFPASIPTLTSASILTNKTLTAPTINGGILDNATVTVDSVAGHTVAGTGTIYGLGIASGAFTTSNIIPATALQSSAVTYAKLLSTIFSGQIATASNAGAGGGDTNYLNLGGLKLCWGKTAASAAIPLNGAQALAVTLPITYASEPKVFLTNGLNTIDSRVSVEVGTINTTTLSISCQSNAALANSTTIAWWLTVGT